MVWNKLKEKCSVGTVIGLVLFVLHLSLVIVAYTAYVNSQSSTAGLVFIVFFMLDAPIHLLPSTVFQMFGASSPLILYGIFGSAMWFLIPWLIDMGLRKTSLKQNKLLRGFIIIMTIPLILIGFLKLSHFSTRRHIQAKRPDEIKRTLNQASSDFLTEKIVYQDDILTSIISVYQMDLLENSGTEIIMAMNKSIVFLNERYQEIHRLNLNEHSFKRIEPLYLDTVGTYGLLGYRYGKGIWLLDSSGIEQWSYTQTNEFNIAPDGVAYGDIDGDGKPEYAVFYKYRDGIHLLDSDGNTRWKHPVYALGHLEITDFNGDGYDQIIYTNSNNARGKTVFTMLDAAGNIANQVDIMTESYEFEVIKWPVEDSDAHILLTEENIIRVVDLDGQTLTSLDAPGCRSFGDVQAQTVKFEKDVPSYLVVKKKLHPDLLALYVFDKNGQLVYQKTDVMDRFQSNDFAVVPIDKFGDEGILVGAVRDMKPLLLEYSLNR